MLLGKDPAPYSQLTAYFPVVQLHCESWLELCAKEALERAVGADDGSRECVLYDVCITNNRCVGKPRMVAEMFLPASVQSLCV